MAHHALQLKTNRALLGWCAWAYLATCECGWQNMRGGTPSYTTRRRSLKAYYDHRSGPIV